MAKRSYSDAEKAAALAVIDACGGNIMAATRQTGISHSTLRTWHTTRGVHKDVTALRETKRREIAEHLEDIIYQILELVPTKLSDENAKTLMVSLGIAVDKMQLLKGQSTANSRQEIRIVSDDKFQ